MATRTTQHVELLFDTMLQGVVYQDETGGILAANAAAERILGYARGEIVGKTAKDLEGVTFRTDGSTFPAEEHPAMVALRTGHELRDVLMGFDNPSRGRRWLSISAVPLFHAGARSPYQVYILFDDVTDRRRLDDALQAALERAASLARFPEENPEPVLRIGADLTLVYANPATSATLRGLSLEPGRPVPEGLVAPARRALATGKRVRHELVCDTQTVALSFAPIGREVNVYGEDITARKKAEAVLRQSEERLRFALDAADAGAWEWDLETNTNVWSPRCWRLYGLDPQGREASYETWLEAIVPEDRAETTRRVQEAAAEGRELRAEWRVRDPDGAVRWIMSRGEPVRDAKGKVVRFTGIVLDITNRKRSEAAAQSLAHEAVLRASEAKFRTLIEHATDIIMVADAEHRVRFWSPGAVAALGWTEAEMLGRKVAELRHPDDDPRAGRVIAALEGGQDTIAATIRFRHKNGEWRVLESTSRNLLSDPTVQGIVVNAHDVTERIRAEQELQKTQRLEALGVLAGGIAHDFNNLLTAVFGHVELALHAVPPRSAAADDLRVAATALGRGRALTHQLLTFARGGMPVRKPCSVDKLVKDAVALCLGASSGVRCEVSVAPDLRTVEADEGQLSQVLGNVLINARQAMPAGGVIKVSAENQTRGGETWVEIRIVDRGEGIPPDVLPRIFDPFFTTKAQGTGLGLATSYSIVRRHGGTISVDSTCGEGTTVTLQLPASTLAEPSAPPPAARASTEGRRVLLMDDEASVRRAGARMLSHLGYTVMTAADGEEAVRLYEQALRAGARFDAVVMDLTVPGGMGGSAAVLKLKELDPEIRAIVCSGYSEDPAMSDPTRHGFCAALPKPYQRSELAAVLDATLAQPGT